MPESRSPHRRYWKGRSPSEVSKRILPQLFHLLVAFGILWLMGVITLGSCLRVRVCIQIRLLLRDTSFGDKRPAPHLVGTIELTLVVRMWVSCPHKPV